MRKFAIAFKQILVYVSRNFYIGIIFFIYIMLMLCCLHLLYRYRFSACLIHFISYRYMRMLTNVISVFAIQACGAYKIDFMEIHV